VVGFDIGDHLHRHGRGRRSRGSEPHGVTRRYAGFAFIGLPKVPARGSRRGG
jgi:hypothetical protein